MALMLLGSIEISDYLDLIARPEDLSFFIAALLEHLSGPTPSLENLDWYNLLKIPTLGLLADSARRCGWGMSNRNYSTAVYPAARRLGDLSGPDRQEAAPRDPPENAAG
jgi:hypothetical protein